MSKYMYNEPLQMPRGRKYGSDYWISYSSKLKRTVTLYSMLEYYYFLVLEMNPEIEYFCEQPCKIEYKIDKKVHSSIFDFWIYYADNHSEFHEVKYSKELCGDTPEALRSQNQIAHQKEWCMNNGCIYQVVTEKDIIISDFYIENLKSLQHRVSRFNAYDYEFFLNALREYIITYDGVVYLEDIIEQEILKKGNELDFLACAYQKGDISMDLTYRPLDNSMEVRNR